MILIKIVGIFWSQFSIVSLRLFVDFYGFSYWLLFFLTLSYSITYFEVKINYNFRHLYFLN